MARSIPRRSPFDLDGTLSEYLRNRSVREKAEFLESRGKQALMGHLETDGEIQDGGHRTIEFDEPVPYLQYKNGKPKEKVVTAIKRQRRAGQSLSEDRTMTLLKELGLLDECTELIVVINEDALLAANFDGRISDEALAGVYDSTESFAFYLETEDEE